MTSWQHTFGGCISGETAPPEYCSTGELEELILSAWFTALWSIHTITFLLESPLQETETGSPSASMATATQKLTYLSLSDTSTTVHYLSKKMSRRYYIPSEQVAAKPKPFTSFAPTFARERADLTAEHTASHISVEDCWNWKHLTESNSIIKGSWYM